jgi:hypothetical protein
MAFRDVETRNDRYSIIGIAGYLVLPMARADEVLILLRYLEDGRVGVDSR